MPQRLQRRLVLTQVSALDGAVAEGDAEVVARLPQLRDGNAIGAADYPRLVVILPFWSTHAHTNTQINPPAQEAGGHARAQAEEEKQDAIINAASLREGGVKPRGEGGGEEQLKPRPLPAFTLLGLCASSSQETETRDQTCDH